MERYVKEQPHIVGHNGRNTIITFDFRHLGPWLLGCVTVWQLLAMLH
jgi:hypothetical protein